MGAFLVALSWLPFTAAYARELVVDNRHPDAADTNSGSVEAPLKTIQRAADIVQPGDRVTVKAGRYAESVRLKTSGTPQKPIVFVGADGHATVLDGADVLTGWQRCKSPLACGGNANSAQLYWTWLPEDTTVFSANLYEGETMLVLAQDPPAPDPFYYDDRSVMRPVPADGYSSTQITDKEYFTQESSDYWVGATVLVRTGNNAVMPRTIAGYDPDEGRITFAETTRHINLGKDQFSVMNHPALIRAAGQYAVLAPGPDGRRKVVLWPKDKESLERDITCSVRKVGFHINGKSHVHIDGFRIRRYSGNTGDLRAGNGILNLAHTPTSGVVVRNCDVLQCKAGSGYWAIHCAGCSESVIEHNYVHHNQMNRGICTLGSTNHRTRRVTIRNNVIQRCGGTGITFYHVDDSKIVGNTVVGNRGNHANGITCYLHSRNILISGNTVLDGNMAITVQESSDVTIRNNLLSGRDGQSRILVLYGRGERISVLNNTILNSSTGGGISIPKDAKHYTIKNNITDGMLHGRDSEQMAGVVLENNLYTKLSWVQKADTLGENAVIERDLNKIFVDPGRGDYRLRPDSPARDAGATVSVAEDIDGVQRPQGKAFDIGAYEYRP
jgi:parallel beta-helix repeat protein